MSEEKNEQPTPKRLRDVREKGQVAKSQDVPSALTVMVIAVYLLAMGGSIKATLLDMAQIPILFMNRPFGEALGIVSVAVLQLSLLIVLPLLAVVMVTALVANVAQVGVLFAFQAAMPKMENLSPGKWVKKVFSVKNAVEFLKNLLKVTVLGGTVWKIFSDYLGTLFHIPDGTISGMWAVTGSAISSLVLAAASVFCVIAAVDYLFQRWQFNKQQMMSKEEIKKEYKESEGDPLIKSKRKQLHQEMLAQNTLGNVRKAKVLITNPTHFAVALDYDKEKIPLPLILAKGEGALAQRMIAIAKEEGIPIMQNVPLAHALFEQGTENSCIPADLIGPVAEVLRWVQSLKTHG